MSEKLKLSTKGVYGLRALVDIALEGETEPVSIASIAARQKMSESYLEQLMAKLKKAKLIGSHRGAQGGYFLLKETDKISVGDVLRALEGDINPVDCLGIEGDCGGADACVTKFVWKRLNDGVNDIVNSIKISALVEESKKCCAAGKSQGGCGRKNKR